MTFRLALSGINAASADLNVTANNIANASTVGFKGSRAEFAELFAVSPTGVAQIAVGNGVKVQNIAQQFTQGNVDFTENNLDLAISGTGFFTLSDNGALVYTRAGAFQTNAEGYVVNANGQRLQVYPPVATGGFNTGALADLRLVTSDSAPASTGSIEMMLNLPANASPPAKAIFDPADTASYNHATSLTVYDTLGAAHTATTYYVKTATPGQWNTYLYVDGAPVGTLPPSPAVPVSGDGTADVSALGYPLTLSSLAVNGAAVAPGPHADTTALLAAVQAAVDAAVAAGGGLPGSATVSLNGSNQISITNSSGVPLNITGADQATLFGTTTSFAGGTPAVLAGTPAPQTLAFSNTGALIIPANGEITWPTYNPSTGAAPMDLTINFSGATQFGGVFTVNAITQDGYTTGKLIGIDIDKSGVVQARFTNGRSQVLGQIAITNFANPNGLQQLNDTNWAESFESGVAVRGQAGSSGFGLVQSGALEASNVDITEQLVNMITAQRNFQANAQVIQTADQVTQTIINIR